MQIVVHITCAKITMPVSEWSRQISIDKSETQIDISLLLLR